MSFSIDEYKQQLKALLPVGKLWDSLKEDPLFDKLLEAEAVEYSRIGERAEALIEEADPRTVLELLPEFEAFAALPDKCIGEQGNLEQRRKALHSKLIAQGGQSIPYFIQVAASLGFSVTIKEFKQHTSSMSVDDALTDIDWSYTWEVQADADTFVNFTVQSGVNEPLRSWGNEPLECMINRLKPAHSNVIFSYI